MPELKKSVLFVSIRCASRACASELEKNLSGYFVASW